LITNSDLEFVRSTKSLIVQGLLQSVCFLTVLSVLLAAACTQSPSLAHEQFNNSATPTGVRPSLSPTTPEPSAASIPSKPTPTGFVFNTPYGLTNTTGVDKSEEIPVERPTLPADLIYINGGRLMRWDHQKNIAIDLIEELDTKIGAGDSKLIQARGLRVDKFAIDSLQQRIALSISTGIVANGVELYDLAIYDFDENKLFWLVEQIHEILQLQISDDGRWVAYITESQYPKLQIISTDSAKNIILTSDCARSGGDQSAWLAWAKDSRKIAWTDQNGLWQYEIGGDTPDLVLSNQIELTDQSGQRMQIRVNYTDFSWSPHGRYLTAKLQLVNSDVYWLTLIDTRLKQFIEIPDTYQTTEKLPARWIAWLSDGRLLVVVPDEPTHLSPHIKIYNVLPTRENYLVFDQRVDFTSPVVRDRGALTSDSTNFGINSVQPINDRLVSFVGNIPGTTSQPHLFILDLKFQMVYQLGQAPYDIQKIVWSADSKGVLILGSHGSILYQSQDGSQFQDLLPIVGDAQTQITWLNRNTVSGGSQ